MYNSCFGFSHAPFENNPDHSFLFLSKDHREVLSALIYFIAEKKGFALVCGDVGTGKTMLINAFLDNLNDSVSPILIPNPKVEYPQILLYIAEKLGIENSGNNILGLIDEIKRALLKFNQNGKSFVLIIDEAHLLSAQSLEDIRLLSNIETPEQKLLHILLVGQYELSHRLNGPEMRQLRQRISVNRFLSPLDSDETNQYIDHRLKMVGSELRRLL